MDDEISLLRWEYGTASKGRINIKGCRFSAFWCLHHYSSDVVEGPPVTAEIFDVDLIVNGGSRGIVPRKRQVLDDPAICRIVRLRDCLEVMSRKGRLGILISITRKGQNTGAKTTLYGYETGRGQGKLRLNYDWVECKYRMEECGLPYRIRSVDYEEHQKIY